MIKTEEKDYLVSVSIYTPKSTTVRAATYGATLLGAESVLPNVILRFWSSQIGFDINLAGSCILALGMGIALGMTSLTRSFHHVSGRRFLVITSGLCVSVSLIVLSETHFPENSFLSILGIGVAFGLLLRTQVPLFANIATHAKGITCLLIFAWSCGAISIHLLVWIFSRVSPFSWLLLWLAVLFFCATLLVRIIPSSDLSSADTPPVNKKFLLTPGGVLLTLALVLFGGVHGIMTNLLPVYVSERMGSELHLPFSIPIIYWLGITTLVLASQRVEKLEERPSNMLMTLFGCSVGCAFLLRTNESSGMVAGTLIFSASLGLLWGLFSTWIDRQAEMDKLLLWRNLLAVFFLGGVAATWLATYLAFSLGIHAIAILAELMILLGILVVSILLVEKRLLRADRR
tara:strand:+ start:2356 stop:3561 length:1206 start_codon:yes stop_codon:yes gene_type:complete